MRAGAGKGGLPCVLVFGARETTYLLHPMMCDSFKTETVAATEEESLVHVLVCKSSNVVCMCILLYNLLREQRCLGAQLLTPILIDSELCFLDNIPK